MSYVKRKIDVVFQLGTGTFGESGFDTITISGKRVLAGITKVGGISMGESHFTIFGMLPEHMDKLSTLGLIPQEVRRNVVTIKASNDEGGMSTVFSGTIANAYFDAQPAPDTAFVVIAYAGLFQAVKPIDPTSIKGPVDVAQVMRSLADAMQLDFENNGVSAKLPTSYFKGTAREQAYQCARDADINVAIDDGVLAIWPKPGARIKPAITVSPSRGMVGYPTFDVQGIQVKSLFNPGLIFGAKVQMESSLKRASGTWYIYTLYHDLESEMPNGQWFTRFLASPPGYVPVTR